MKSGVNYLQQLVKNIVKIGIATISKEHVFVAAARKNCPMSRSFILVILIGLSESQII